jgi:hypothetical protein
MMMFPEEEKLICMKIDTEIETRHNKISNKDWVAVLT